MTIFATPQPATPPDTAQARVNRTRSALGSFLSATCGGWEALVNEFHATTTVTPEEFHAALGTDAVKYYEASAEFAQFLATFSAKYGREDITARIIAKSETIPAHTKHNDGTVTLDEVIEEEAEEETL